jgi:hypothetical protein
MTCMKLRLDLHDTYSRGGDIDRLAASRRMTFIDRGRPGRASLSSKATS